MDQNVMAHYVVDGQSTVIPVTSVVQSDAMYSSVPMQGTSNVYARQQQIFPQGQPPQVGQQHLEAHVTVFNFEQCCICSVVFEERRPGPVPQPDINRILTRLLDVIPEPTFYKNYLPLCDECISLLRKFDKLRIELEFIKTRVVTNVIETLTQVRADDGCQLEKLKDQILNRWSSADSNPNRKHKRGYSAANTETECRNGDLSWATYNNMANSSTVISVEEPESSNVAPNTTVQNIEVMSTNTADDPLQDVNCSTNTNNHSYVPTENVTMNANVAPNDRNIVDDDRIILCPENQQIVRQEGSEVSQLQVQHASEEHRSKSKEDNEKRKGRPPKKKKPQGIQQDVNALICTNCGRTYENNKAFTAHNQVCVSDDLGMEKRCSICIETKQDTTHFETWMEYKSHVLQNHPIVRLEVCQFCRLRFLPFGIKHHKCLQNYKSQVDQEPIFQCDLCERSYNTRSNLTDHVRRTHKDQKYLCNLCGKSYGSPMLLNFHMERHTSVVTKFKCDVCGVCLSSNYSLKEHKKRHTGEQPYACSTCDKKFASRTIFNAHQMVHSDLKPHMCSICGKGFKLRGTMKRHLVRHQIHETKYTKKCPLCPNISFRKVWILKSHMKSEHAGTLELQEILKKYKDVNDEPAKLNISGRGKRGGKKGARFTKQSKQDKKTESSEAEENDTTNVNVDDDSVEHNVKEDSSTCQTSRTSEDSKDVKTDTSRHSRRIMARGSTKNEITENKKSQSPKLIPKKRR